jgi:hypothetical protein
MVRNDDFFLKKWVEYYSAQIGASNLYVYFDGNDQVVPDFCSGVNVCVRERVPGLVAAADRGRIDFLSTQAAELLKRYDMVIGTDVDEFLVVDPALGKTLPEFLSQLPERVSYSGLGIDVGQHLEKEAEIDGSVPFLKQRHHARLSTRYSKSTVITKPVQWGSGFHRVRNGNFKIIKGILLDGEDEKIIDFLRKEQKRCRCAILCYDEEAELLEKELLLPIGGRGDLKMHAKMLFARLRECDSLSPDVIYAHLPQKEGLGLALYNRMIRAAAHTVKKV